MFCLDPQPWPESSYELGLVCPSTLLSRSFLRIGSLLFLKLSIMLEAHVLLCVTEPDFLVKIPLPKKWGKWAKNRQKWGFFNLLENLVIIFFWIWSVMKIYIICCIPAKIPYLGKTFFLRYEPNSFRQSDYRIFKSTISLRRSDEEVWFSACWYRFMEIRSWLKNIGVGMVKSGSGHFVLRTLILAVCQGEINGINWYWVCLIQIQER